MLKRNTNISNKSRLIVVGSLLILIGSLVIGGKYFYNYQQEKNEEQLIDTFFEEQKELIEDTNQELSENVEDKKIHSTKSKVDYFAVLKIPKIGLEKGLCNKGSYCNNVDRNIFVLKESNMPNEDKGNVILAGHSGSGRIAYFKNLYKLQKDDEVSIFYNGLEYKYKVVNQYDIDKTGTANIIRNTEVSTLTLITCRQNTDKQIVYICELVAVA